MHSDQSIQHSISMTVLGPLLIAANSSPLQTVILLAVKQCVGTNQNA